MSLSKNGLWFSIKTLENGSVDYEIYRYNDLLDSGTTQSEDEMIDRFDALCEAASRPLC
jgi:hypothetical protein